MSKDKQRNRWMLTINNPDMYGYDHDTIKRILIDKFSTMSYIALVDEKGKTFHTHCFVFFNSRVRFSSLKKAIPQAHIDEINGTTSECISYLKKDGKWLNDTEKQGQKIEGTFEEWGERPPEKGKSTFMASLYQLVKEGYSTAEIIAENQDYIPMIDTIERLRTMLLTEKYRSKRRLDLEVIYISGATGTGKTRGVQDMHGDANVYRVTDYQHPFDGYNNCQPVIAFDEFRSSLKISDMLQYCDVYPIELPARYANKFACFNTVYIISNWKLEEQYKEVQIENPETWRAFLRRIHEVRIYNSDGTIDVYSSVEQYLKRNEKFRKPEQGEVPFDD